MAATSASMKNLLPIILFLFTALLVTTAFAKSPRLVAKLIHRDSIQSLYYNPDATSLSYRRELRNSIRRFAYLLGANTTNEDDYRAEIIADDNHSIFMANISFGEPPVPQLLHIDTGSNLLWLQCLPCTKSFKQFYPIFDPSKSSTYAILSCHSPECFQDKCDPSEHCLYNEGYFDGTTTIGNLAHEKLTFQTSDEGISTISDILIGCGHENVDTTGGQQPSGILGLGPRITLSLAYRLGNKFSYCIGSIRDPHYAFNNLILGDGAKIEGNLSPLDNYDNGLYYVRMEGISVGLKWLDINPDVFKRMGDKGGVIIDSGTTLTYLNSGAYRPLRAEVQSLLNGLTCVTDPSKHLCCEGNINRDLKQFPVVTFHFAGGAALVLDINSMFIENGPRGFCIAVVEDPFDINGSVIGVMAQQSYNVAYDNNGHTISFQRIECRLLEPKV